MRRVRKEEILKIAETFERKKIRKMRWRNGNVRRGCWKKTEKWKNGIEKKQKNEDNYKE